MSYPFQYDIFVGTVVGIGEFSRHPAAAEPDGRIIIIKTTTTTGHAIFRIAVVRCERATESAGRPGVKVGISAHRNFHGGTIDDCGYVIKPADSPSDLLFYDSIFI